MRRVYYNLDRHLPVISACVTATASEATALSTTERHRANTTAPPLSWTVACKERLIRDISRAYGSVIKKTITYYSRASVCSLCNCVSLHS